MSATLVEVFAGTGGASWACIAPAGRTSPASSAIRPPLPRSSPPASPPSRPTPATWTSTPSGAARRRSARSPLPAGRAPPVSAGARLDERDGWPVTLAAIDACRPTWFLAENVLGWSYHMGLCGGGHGACPACHLEGVAGELARRSFAGQWRLNAADFGVPQRRRRLIHGRSPSPGPETARRHHAHPEAAEGLGLRPWLTLGEAVGGTLHRGSCDRRACYPCDDEHGRACSEPGA